MAIRRELSGLPLVEDSRHSILRVRSSGLVTLEKHVYQRYPQREWGTFFEFGYRRTSWGLALSYVDGFWPEPGDLDRQVGLTRFVDQYSRRAFHHTSASPLAMGVVHSHPQGCCTYPSSLDDDMDSYFAREFGAYGKGKPYCSLILQRNPITGFTFTGRVYDRGEWLPVEKLLTVDDQLELFSSEAEESRSATMGNSEATRARLVSVLGQPSAVRLERATAGIIGCSGTGSPAAHVLARAGVGNFVLVDPKRFADSNLERMHGSRCDHIDRGPAPYKVEIVADLIKSINPNANITTLAGNILHENVIDELLRCDLLLGCTDTQHGRAQLSDLAQHYLLPSVDLGVLMEGQQGRLASQIADVVMYSPDFPCAFCSGRIDGIELSNELMSEEERTKRQIEAKEAAERGDDPDQYWRQRPRQLHTVGYLTTMLGALGAGYAEGLLTGTFSPPHSWFQFDIGRERFAVVAPPRDRMAGCCCAQHIGWGDAANPYRNVVKPDHWPNRALLLSRAGRPSSPKH
jgi:ThiF family